MDWGNLSLSLDSIGNIFYAEKCFDKDNLKNYLTIMNTIGGKILFPKHINYYREQNIMKIVYAGNETIELHFNRN